MLSKFEKELLVTIWEKVAEDAEEIGAESLLRMFSCFPKTKTYFAHLDISPQSEHLRSHGKKIIMAIVEGSKNISALTTTMAPLSALHAYQLKIHPTNFKLLCHCILVTLACRMADEFTPVAHAALDKFLSALAAVLSEKYR
ncbi:hemoglobin subunit zeta-like [Scleropages formosus]|uniref:Hemoglobin alpha embryonic-4 n=1 Tax=Scleropages formosus TaxID=113540 RepID=A0A0P7Y2F2_SCLFO|nr:hemoglobin subunit pi-like [Scleropages formosus]KPP59843.1 hemoglobin subunit zeta-like [Scleropages formosus]